ncbi:VOC family protein [Streptomyces solisilvae]|uniref:VOC family protein n=1 Tax=Streptomyces malaysiensis TaxID=92644 RepID=UPI0036C4615F
MRTPHRWTASSRWPAERAGFPAQRRPTTPRGPGRVGGREVGSSARHGFIKTGASEIELIQPLKGRPPYTEFLDLHGEGVHHLAYVVEGIDQYLESLRAR